MAVPLRVVVPGYGKEKEAGDVGMLTNVLAYLQKLVEEGKESGERPASGRGEALRSSPSSAASGAFCPLFAQGFFDGRFQFASIDFS